MSGTVTRDVQTLPIITPTSQGAAHITLPGDPLDGNTIQEPFVILLDENDPGRKVSPAGDDTLKEVVAELSPASEAGLGNEAASTLSAVFLAANANRRGVQIVNEATSANLYVAYADTASLTAYTVKLVPSAYWEMPPTIYTGAISGIWDVAEPLAFARVTQIAVP